MPSTSAKKISSAGTSPVKAKVTDKLTAHGANISSLKGIKRGTNSAKEVSPAKLARQEANDSSAVAAREVLEMGDEQQSSGENGKQPFI